MTKGTKTGFGGTRSFSFSFAWNRLHLCLFWQQCIALSQCKFYLKFQHVLDTELLPVELDSLTLKLVSEDAWYQSCLRKRKLVAFN